jgi:hypothetical protein
MPNRKTFDEREKVDHSSHPLDDQQPSDLKPDIQDSRDKVVKPTRTESDTAPGSGNGPSSRRQKAE